MAVELDDLKIKQEPAKMGLIGRLPGETPPTTRGQDIAIGTAKALIPDLTNPREAAEYFVDLIGHTKAGGPGKGAFTFASKRLIKEIPAVKRGLDALGSVKDEVVSNVARNLNIRQPSYAGVGNLQINPQTTNIKPNNPLMIKRSSTSINDKLVEQGSKNLNKGKRQLNVPKVEPPPKKAIQQLHDAHDEVTDLIEKGTKKGEGIVKRTPTSALIKEQLKNLDPRLAKRDVAKRYADQPDFIQKLSELNAKVQKWYNGPGKGRLAGFPKEGRTITAPDGVKYRIRDSNVQGGTGKFSINQDISARNTAQIRKIAQGPDIKTLAKQFEGKVPDDQIGSAIESYVKTNKKVYNALTKARKRYNVGKPKAEHATIEHIFDVDFHKRLKDEAVKGFSGQGADELWNLKMIDYALNSKTGALNKKAKDMGQVLIDAVRKDEFIDYNQVVKDFVDNDLGSKIAKLKPKDWDIITKYSMKNPKLNMQQILLNYTKGK